MCGIAGIVNFDINQKVNPEQLKEMTNVIFHRGPDDEGHYINKNVGLGFRRLSIIDLKTGHQPLSNSDESIWITFNGEIYNYLELKKDLDKKGYRFKTDSDTEVIVNLYEEYGENCVAMLRGMFAFVIWNDRRKILFGARDRFGIKPFYYYRDNEQFVWGSEIKAIAAAPAVKLSLDFNALDTYLAYGYNFNQHSIYHQVEKLKASHYFILDPDKPDSIQIKRYWEIKYEPDYSKTESDWQELIMESLREAVKIRLMSDVPLGAFLSGGIDSGSVVALMSQVSDVPVKTFSIGFKEKAYNELPFASLVAERYHTEHHEMIVEPESIDLLPKLVSYYDEPFADSSAIPTYYVSKFAREYVTVALSGDGGDELFAGYKSYPKLLALMGNRLNNKIAQKLIWKNLNSLLPDYFYGKGYSYYLSRDKKNIGAYACLWKDYERKNLFRSDIYRQFINESPENQKINILLESEGDDLTRLQQLDMKSYLTDDILTKVDRASMMNSLEARVPLLDHKFAELTFKIPSELKLKDGNKKYIFKNAMKPLLPPELFQQKKHGFGVPLNVWFKGDLKDYIYESLVNNERLSAIFNPKYLTDMVAFHQKGQRDYSSKIWSLLILAEWFKQNREYIK